MSSLLVLSLKLVLIFLSLGERIWSRNETQNTKHINLISNSVLSFSGKCYCRSWVSSENYYILKNGQNSCTLLNCISGGKIGQSSAFIVPLWSIWKKKETGKKQGRERKENVWTICNKTTLFCFKTGKNHLL